MIYVLYHDNCMDGLAAAWVAFTKFGNNATYIPVQYNQPLPEMVLGKDTDVYILDFSYPRKTLVDLQWTIGKLQVIDHHKTAQAELKGLIFAFFDMTKSGAVLTWEYFHPNEQVPELLLYVQDRDLWEWKLEDSREISAGLASYPKSIIIFDSLMEKDISLSYIKNKGRILLEQTKQVVNSLASKAELNNEVFILETKEPIPILNSSTMQSELGERLLELHPNAPFAAIYFHTTLKERIWSLRSRGDFDVSVIAKLRNGGGHKAAAGFKEIL